LASEFKIKGVIYLFTAVNLKSDYHLSASTESKWTICISNGGSGRSSGFFVRENYQSRC